jgi:hypothetical protein
MMANDNHFFLVLGYVDGDFTKAEDAIRVLCKECTNPTLSIWRNLDYQAVTRLEQAIVPPVVTITAINASTLGVIASTIDVPTVTKK